MRTKGEERETTNQMQKNNPKGNDNLEEKKTTFLIDVKITFPTLGNIGNYGSKENYFEIERPMQLQRYSA